MFGLILLLLIVVPIVELYVLVQVAGGLGWPLSIGLLLAVSIVGSFLMRWQTRGQLGRIQARLNKGQLPSEELVDGGLMIFGAALLLTPGFFTDLVGLAMFIPPLRIFPRRLILSRLRGRITTMSTAAGQGFGMGFGVPGSNGPRQRRSGSFIDVDEVIENVDITRVDDNPRQLPPNEI